MQEAIHTIRAQELCVKVGEAEPHADTHDQSSGAVCKSRGGRPGLPILTISCLRFLWT